MIKIPDIEEYSSLEKMALEKETTKTLSEKNGVVIATGGGTVMDEENYNALRKNGMLVLLKRGVDKLEISGRPMTPDRAALARSSQLAETARRIVDANLRGQFPVALEQLNEALRLNPNNEAAVTLKDRIQTDVGGQAVAVLSNASEKEYQRAVAELQKGNTIVALAIGEVVSDTLYVHVEKARVDYAGAYQAIVSLFAKNALEEGTLYINREDDSGEERLRYSKMSYRPIRLIDKYWVTLENPA